MNVIMILRRPICCFAGCYGRRVVSLTWQYTKSDHWMRACVYSKRSFTSARSSASKVTRRDGSAHMIRSNKRMQCEYEKRLLLQSFHTVARNSGFMYEKPLNVFSSRFITASLSLTLMGVRRAGSLVNSGSKLETSLRFVCARIRVFVRQAEFTI